jgi:hypothetical protein
MTSTCEGDTATIASAPSTPRSQSIATIRLQRVERDLGPLRNLVLRSPRRSSKSTSCGSSALYYSLPYLSRTSAPTSIADAGAFWRYVPFGCKLLHSGHLIWLAEAMANLPSFAPGPTVNAENYFDLLTQLDDIAGPGVPESVFRRLYRQCRRCGHCMTSRTILFHKCKAPRINVNVEVIDLTNED